MGIKTTMVALTGMGIGSFLTYQVVVNKIDEKTGDIYENAKSQVERSFDDAQVGLKKTFNPTLGDRIYNLSEDMQDSTKTPEQYISEISDLTRTSFSIVYHAQPDSAKKLLTDLISTISNEKLHK